VTELADTPEVWFQQGGATVHTAVATIEFLRIFENQIISRNTKFPLPPHSPDLTAPDVFL